MNIRKKLTVILLSISIVPLIFFSVFTIILMQNDSERSVAQGNLSKANDVSIDVSALIDKNMSGLKLLAQNATIRSFNVNNIKPILVEANQTYSDLSNIVVDDDKGQQLVKSDNSAPSNISDRSYFKGAISGKDANVSEVLVSKSSGSLIINIATPIRDKQGGKITGVIQGTNKLDTLNEFIKQRAVDGITIYAVDQDGKLIAHSDKKIAAEEEGLT